MINYKPLVLNRRAKYDFNIHKRYIAGLVLKGFEVKQIRMGQASLASCYVHTNGQEAWLKNLQLKSPPSTSQPSPKHKLLLHRNEIKQLFNEKQKGHQLILLSLGEQGRYLKAELAVASSKKKYDKRESVKARQAKREAERQIKRIH